jgi:hypothetical protein
MSFQIILCNQKNLIKRPFIEFLKIPFQSEKKENEATKIIFENI